MIFGSGYDQAGAMLMQQASLAEQHALNQARMDAEANQFAARQREAEDARRFQFAEFAANRADRAANIDQQRASFDFSRAAEAARVADSTSRLGLERDRFKWDMTKPSARELQAETNEAEFLWADALDQAGQGLFKELADVAKAYPTFSQAQKSALLRQSQRARQTLAGQDAEAESIATLLNTNARQKLIESKAVEEAAKAIENRWFTGSKGAKAALQPFTPGVVPTEAQTEAMTDFPAVARARESLAVNEAAIGRINALKPQALQDLVRYEPSVGFVPTVRHLPGDAAPRFNFGGSGVVTVRSDADYVALPSGTIFIGPDGVRRRKP